MGYPVGIETVIKLARDFRLNKRKVVFTHGAFDLFHAGHSLFLNKSKSVGEILVVGVEPDSNVSIYKHILRPIIPQEQREEILLNHKAIDFVFMIDEIERCMDEYYMELYRIIEPNIVTFGKNFIVKDRKNAKVKRVRFRELDAEVSSTTKIITSILNRYQPSKKDLN